MQKPQPQTHSMPAGASQASVPPVPGGSGLLPILLIGGIVFLVAVAAAGFFVILPLLEDESPSWEDSGGSSQDFMNTDDIVDDNAEEPSGSLLSGSGVTSGAPATTPAPMRTVSSGSPAQSAAGSVVHGTLSTGTPVVAVQGSVPASGGTITVAKPGSPIDGLTFVAPAGAYSSGQQVTISSAPVTGNTFGSYFNPATPLISIDAGKGYADEPILVTIPVTIPDDQFAMAFYYDDVSKKLEGVPTANQESRTISITTRHFSNIIVSLINKDVLDGIRTADSGFRPGVDDWEFGNPGSFIAKGGFCSGASATAMWYYVEQVQKTHAPHLFNRFDNNGRGPILTPGAMARGTVAVQGIDDTLGYRFASVIQEKTMSGETYWKYGKFIADITGDITTFREFKYSILMTGEPQYVSVYPGTGSLAHAIVCYKVSDTTMWVADPNHPGEERKIALAGNTLTPYTFGENSQDSLDNTIKSGDWYCPVIKYVAKSAMFPWPLLETEYAKLQEGTVGDDMFPPYKLYFEITNDDGTKQTIVMDGGRNRELKQINVGGKTVIIRQQAFSDMADLKGRNKTGSVSSRDFTAIKQPMTLTEGSNIVGVYGSGINGGWLGFDWIDLNYKPMATVATAAATTLQAEQHYTATIYAVTDSSSYDADCGFADKAYERSGTDPYCEKIPSYSATAVMCGKPPGKCIDTAWNNGIHGVFTYYNTLGTKADGSTYVTARLKDGYMYYYAKDGTVVSQVTYKDDKQIRTVK